MAKTDREAAESVWAKARDAARLNPTPENREAAKAAWAALEAVSPPMKRSGFVSRAGQKQYAFRRAGR
jgi:hypothetical protein